MIYSVDVNASDPYIVPYNFESDRRFNLVLSFTFIAVLLLCCYIFFMIEIRNRTRNRAPDEFLVDNAVLFDASDSRADEARGVYDSVFAINAGISNTIEVSVV